MIAAARSRGMFICPSTGSMSTPVLRTEAVHDPVMAPGNMMMSVITDSSASGERPKRRMRSRASTSSSPFFSITFMKIMAVMRTSETSR